MNLLNHIQLIQINNKSESQNLINKELLLEIIDDYFIDKVSFDELILFIINIEYNQSLSGIHLSASYRHLTNSAKLVLAEYLLRNPKFTNQSKLILTLIDSILNNNEKIIFCDCIKSAIKKQKNFKQEFIDYVSHTTKTHPSSWISISDVYESFGTEFINMLHELLCLKPTNLTNEQRLKIKKSYSIIKLIYSIIPHPNGVIKISRSQELNDKFNSTHLSSWVVKNFKSVINQPNLNSKLYKHPISESFLNKSSSEVNYLKNIVSNGEFCAPDLLTGKNLNCEGSVLAFGRTAYIFRGNLPYYLISAGPWSAMQGAYIPALNKSISFENSSSASLSNDLPGLIAAVIISLAKLEGDISKKKGVTVVVGSTENFAHHIWNFYSFLDWINSNKLYKNITSINFSGTEFFGPLEDIFQDIPRYLFRTPKRSNIYSSFEFNSKILIPCGEFLINKSLPLNIISAAKNRSGKLPKILDISTLNNSYPIILFGLRLGDKSWVEQQTGIVSIAKRLLRDYQNPLFLIDGFTLPVGKDYITYKWERTRSKIIELSKEIKNSIGVSAVNLVGVDFDEFVKVAQFVDVYCVPYGTAQHKISWFSSCNGVCYLPPHFNEKRRLISPASSASLYSPTPVFVTGKPVSAGEDRTPNYKSRRINFSNISISSDDLYIEIKKLIDSKTSRGIINYL